MEMIAIDPKPQPSGERHYHRLYWRLWNAPYSAHASGDTWTRTHLVADTGNPWHPHADTALCGRRVNHETYHIDDGQGWRGVCKRCRAVAERSA